MIIQPNWTVSDQGPWQLIHNDEYVISLMEVQGTTSTQGILFVGTKEECESEISRLRLKSLEEVEVTHQSSPSSSDI
jgi:hypothetical protein